jgi:predicted Zn-dependent protease
VTVRDMGGTASGWAGLSHHDWTKIDVDALNERAIQKCVDSANPVAVEPGRYTAILEPEAVGQLMWFAIADTWRPPPEGGRPPYGKPPEGPSKIGQRMLDERISVISDPTDPDVAYTPFAWDGERYRKIVWFDKGILRTLWYNRGDEAKKYGDTEGLIQPWPLAFRMTGGDTSIEDMIKSTPRGILVTHFTELTETDGDTLSVTGNTRDGLWLIENGKITKPVENFRFNDSPLFTFNNVQQLGVPVVCTVRVIGTISARWPYRPPRSWTSTSRA